VGKFLRDYFFMHLVIVSAYTKVPQLQNADCSRVTSLPKVSDADLYQRLSEERLRLRQIMDQTANKLALEFGPFGSPKG
jgi:hypothetical protein